MAQKSISWVSCPVILASKSPRRRQLLQASGIDFEIVSKEIVEDFPPHLSVYEVPVHIAKNKAAAIKNEVSSDALIIAADTIVALDNEIFGKPKDAEAAYQTLSKLSGTAHEAITGVCLANHHKEVCFYVATKVFFKTLTDKEIFYYIEHYKPYDRAGAYAIQDWIGMVGVEKIEGCYFNVVGLPVSRLLHELKAF